MTPPLVSVVVPVFNAEQHLAACLQSLFAHRMSTLDICDRIVVIENGRITALGTPDELSLSSDFYRTAMASAGIRRGP